VPSPSRVFGRPRKGLESPDLISRGSIGGSPRECELGYDFRPDQARLFASPTAIFCESSLDGLVPIVCRRTVGRNRCSIPNWTPSKPPSICAYAASQGYVLDRKESWRGSAVMRHANGDKVIIKRDADGHYVYFSVRSDTDHGTIIDFTQHRLGLTFGAIRKELRPWIGKSVEVLP
jgi:hypothetical protein